LLQNEKEKIDSAYAPTKARDCIHLKGILYRHFTLGGGLCGDLDLGGLDLNFISSVRHPISKKYASAQPFA
jgi:hypothetical protein